MNKKSKRKIYRRKIKRIFLISLISILILVTIVLAIPSVTINPIYGGINGI
jgi:predicted nucleic acid-binding Zn ribbon protein